MLSSENFSLVRLSSENVSHERPSSENFSPGWISQQSEALAPTISCGQSVEPLLKKTQGSPKEENL